MNKHITSIKRGFTLIELLVVIAIIGLLSSVVLASLNKARAKGRDSKKLQDLNQLRNALELYYAQNKAYPITNASALSTQLGNCAFTATSFGGGYTTTADWIPGLVAAKFISKLPETAGSYTGVPGAQSCYVYVSDGNNYKISNLKGMELLCAAGDTKAVCLNSLIANGSPYTTSISTDGAKNWAFSSSVVY